MVLCAMLLLSPIDGHSVTRKSRSTDYVAGKEKYHILESAAITVSNPHAFKIVNEMVYVASSVGRLFYYYI